MALTIDAPKWRRKRGVARVLDALGADQGLTRYVGGAIRDDLLNHKLSDLDLATRIHPEEVMERLTNARVKVVPTGIDHGTVTAVSDGKPVEITTLRRDVSTDGRRATIAFTDDWKEDAARRDFTINALSADPATGQIFDYFGGLADLETRTVRFIGDPIQRIAEDHLRILRFFRFHARFGEGAPDGAALEACVQRANDLMALSRERVADELLKLLGLPNPAPTVALMVERAILAPVIPEIIAPSAAALAALVAAEKSARVEGDAIRRLSALLPRDAKLAEAVAARLRLSNKAKKRLGCAAHADLGPSPKALAYRVGTDCALDRLLIAGETAAAASIRNWAVPRLPIGGGELIKRGLVEGPVVARTLRAIDKAWADHGFPEGEAFEEMVGRHVAGARG
ncbi:MAG: CCA tRNA nucleotidyltransferase [Sphingomicrobium sp.]